MENFVAGTAGKDTRSKERHEVCSRIKVSRTSLLGNGIPGEARIYVNDHLVLPVDLSEPLLKSVRALRSLRVYFKHTGVFKSNNYGRFLYVRSIP